MSHSLAGKLLAVLLMALLALSIFAAGKRGLAEVVAQGPRYSIERWRSGNVTLSAAQLNDIERELLVAHRLRPENPLLNEDLGRLIADRVAGRQLSDPEVLASRLRALSLFKQALELQPSSGYAYVNYAGARFQSGQIDQVFFQALGQALQRAPWIRAVALLAIDYGVASWQLMQPPMRELIRQTIRAHSQWMMFDQKPVLRYLLQRYQRPDLECLVDRELSDCPTK